MKNIALLEEKSRMDLFLNQGPRPLASFSFVSLFAWGDFFDFEFQIINDCLCVFAHGDSGNFLYLPPLGRNFNSTTIDMVFAEMAKGSAPKPVHRIENIPENLLSAFGQGSYNQYLKPAEYVYRKEDLVVLKGNAYKSKRHDCNSFTTRHGVHSFEPYTDGDFNVCLELFERWVDNRSKTSSDDIYLAMLQENRLVHARLLRFWQDLGIIVRVLKVKGKIVGYTFGFALDEKTFCIYAEIADLKLAGAAATMFKHFCADKDLGQFTRINTMDDFAMPKVAQAKQAYHPSELISSYSVSLKIGK